MTGTGRAGNDTGGFAFALFEVFVVDAVNAQRAFFHHPVIGIVFPGAIGAGPGAVLGAAVCAVVTGATVVPPGTFGRLVKYIEDGEIRPLLAETYPLKDFVEAQKAFIAKQHVGNIVVTMS